MRRRAPPSRRWTATRACTPRTARQPRLSTRPSDCATTTLRAHLPMQWAMGMWRPHAHCAHRCRPQGQAPHRPRRVARRAIRGKRPTTLLRSGRALPRQRRPCVPRPCRVQRWQHATRDLAARHAQPPHGARRWLRRRREPRESRCAGAQRRQPEWPRRVIGNCCASPCRALTAGVHRLQPAPERRHAPREAHHARVRPARTHRARPAHARSQARAHTRCRAFVMPQRASSPSRVLPPAPARCWPAHACAGCRHTCCGSTQRRSAWASRRDRVGVMRGDWRHGVRAPGRRSAEPSRNPRCRAAAARRVRRAVARQRRRHESVALGSAVPEQVGCPAWLGHSSCTGHCGLVSCTGLCLTADRELGATWPRPAITGVPAVPRSQTGMFAAVPLDGEAAARRRALDAELQFTRARADADVAAVRAQAETWTRTRGVRRCCTRSHCSATLRTMRPPMQTRVPCAPRLRPRRARCEVLRARRNGDARRNPARDRADAGRRFGRGGALASQCRCAGPAFTCGALPWL